MTEDDIVQPPQEITSYYESATTNMQKLKIDFTDPEADNNLKEINDKIAKATRDYNEAHSSEQVTEGCWQIAESFWRPAYERMRNSYNLLASDAKKAKADILEELNVQREYVEKKHLPSEWAKPLPLDGVPIERVLRELNRSGDPVKGKHDAAPGSVKYSWATMELEDGSVIIGWKFAGRGKRVCIEREEEGRIIRRLEAASDISPSKLVQEYSVMHNSKKLSEGQAKWNKDFREDFLKLHWITRSQTKLRNTAAGRRDPEAYCCVEFKENGVQLLTVSRFESVVGKSDARQHIQYVCQRDDFPVPWKTGPVATYDDAAKLEKDPERRRQMNDMQASQPQQSTSAPQAYTSAGVGGGGSNASGGVEANFIALANEMRAAMAQINKSLEKAEATQASFLEKMGRLMDNMANNAVAAAAAGAARPAS